MVKEVRIGRSVCEVSEALNLLREVGLPPQTLLALFFRSLQKTARSVTRVLPVPNAESLLLLALLQAQLMRGLHHPNIVRIRGIQCSPPRIVMDHIAGGSLFNLLHYPQTASDAVDALTCAVIRLRHARLIRA